jgi:hypothetical protein
VSSTQSSPIMRMTHDILMCLRTPEQWTMNDILAFHTRQETSIMATQRFKTNVQRSGSRTYIVMPFNPNKVWGVKQRHHITGSINGCAIRGSLGSDGSQYFLPLGAAWRRDNRVEAGAEVEVVLAPEGPQADTLAPDILAALERELEARAFFESLATFYRNGYIRWIEGAKRSETRQTRIAEMLSLLKAGKKQR